MARPSARSWRPWWLAAPVLVAVLAYVLFPVRVVIEGVSSLAMAGGDPDVPLSIQTIEFGRVPIEVRDAKAHLDHAAAAPSPLNLAVAQRRLAAPGW